MRRSVKLSESSCPAVPSARVPSEPLSALDVPQMLIFHFAVLKVSLCLRPRSKSSLSRSKSCPGPLTKNQSLLAPRSRSSFFLTALVIVVVTHSPFRSHEALRRRAVPGLDSQCRVSQSSCPWELVLAPGVLGSHLSPLNKWGPLGRQGSSCVTDCASCGALYGTGLQHGFLVLA